MSENAVKMNVKCIVIQIILAPYLDQVVFASDLIAYAFCRRKLYRTRGFRGFFIAPKNHVLNSALICAAHWLLWE